jgi:transcriptional regulator with XRE-family HTH domain
MDFVKIGDCLRTLRVQKGLSALHVSEEVGIDYKTLLFYESGRKITLEKLHKLAEFYATPMDSIINKKAIITIVWE